ncbi:SMP-30/gluconolactonase/LRE family protein [Nocardioides speluncae]|uniref:SMP-30/gluconolactonase/LRE family protein n=1 Tax=Nocardioides speluncae TaxID=2670337 RepID=UPI000D690F9A|nr:gluconolaconase [Nocardioides speluncae]
MNRNLIPALTALALSVLLSLTLSSATAPAFADDSDRTGRTDQQRPGSYLLPGDPVVDGAGGSKFEGIGVDRATGRYYVSEVTGGEIHRGSADRRHAEEWLPGDGADGRFTARGVTVDGAGRVYVAGGPNGTGNDRPDVWVYDRDGRLLAALQVPSNEAFVNDVAIGPDGAAYFTNSNAPQIFRVANDGAGWAATTWADATGTITTQPGFNLGGIVLSSDRSAFVVAQGNTGDLWRFDARTGAATEIATGADLVNADGLVLRGRDLVVIRNFSKSIAHLELSADGARARLVGQRATDPDRVLTTGKLLGGRLLLVDSHFDENVGLPPYEVLSTTMPR